MHKKSNAWVKLLICFFFGYFGVHKFMEKKIGMGVLYFFTAGLFGIGWMYDCIKYLFAALKSIGAKENSRIVQENKPVEREYPPVEIEDKPGFQGKKVLLWVLTIFMLAFGLTFLPHFSGIIALVVAVIAAPIEKWQNLISRVIKGKAKKIAVILMSVLAIISTPKDDQTRPVESGKPADIVSLEKETQPPADVEEISFSEETYIVSVGGTTEIPFAVLPENALCDALEVSVDKGEIASVKLVEEDKQLVQVTGIVPGEVTIALSSGGTVHATKTVTVAVVQPEKIAIHAEPQEPRIGTKGVFTVAFVPENVTKQEVSWQSDAPEVIQVNEDGSFEALAIGEATITATHENGISGTLLVKVLPVEVESVILSSDWEEGKAFCKGDTMTLSATVSPENATDKTLIWTSDNEAVAVVTEEGVVQAVSSGSAVITAKATSGKTGTYQITVNPSPQKFKISATIRMISNDHVGNSWSTGYEFNNEQISSGSTVTIVPGETFSICGWAQDNDSRPDHGQYLERLTLTEEMCQTGFTVEGEAVVIENGGRYSGNSAVWYVTIKFTPI